MTTNMWQDLLGNKFLYQFIAFVCDIDCMMRNTNEQSKLKELRNVKDGSYTLKTREHITAGSTLSVFIKRIEMRKYFFYIICLLLKGENIS